MNSWRDELVDAIKSQAEREAEEHDRKRKRLGEALVVAEEATAHALEALRYAHQQLVDKNQAASFEDGEGGSKLVLFEQSLAVALSRETAIVSVTVNDGRPREFDFAKDRHLAPRDVEEYVGRRAVELVRAAHKVRPW